MRKFILTPALFLAAALLAAPLATADDEAVYTKLMKEKAGTIVSVKIVLAVKISSPRGGHDQEVNTVATGVVVDAAGLILLSDNAFDAARMMGIPRRMLRQQGASIASSPTSIRVTFPGDTKEYDAVLGAKDSKLGIGFVLIKDLADKVVEPVNFGLESEPRVGQTLYGVTRLGQGFDHAAMCGRVKVSGHVTKPRDMWIVQGGGMHMAEPLYDAAGAVAGIVVDQEGVGEGGGSRPFLLPMKVVKPTLAGALKKSKAELERILEEEEEAAAEAEDEKDDDADEEKKDDDAGKKDADAGKKDDAPKKDDDDE